MKRLAWLGVIVTALLGTAMLAAAGWASGACDQYSALGSAVGFQTTQASGGVLLTDVDASVPGAQASIDSLTGSTSWSGAPYSSTVAGNTGLAGVDNEQVPVYAESTYPTKPKSTKSTPSMSLVATTGEHSSSAKADGGAPPSESATAGHTTISADSTCADGTLRGAADTTVDMVDVAGVLKVRSIHGHAEVVVDPSGRRTMSATMDAQGATVLGQPVAITDQGLVIGGSAAPLPGNPLAKALSDASIDVKTLAGTNDPEHGFVSAPTVEITVTRGVQGVGSGPATTTYTLGRVLARAGAASSESAVDDADLVIGGDPSTGGDVVAAAPAPNVALPPGAPPAVARVRSPVRTAAQPALSLIGARNLGVYPAVALSALVLLGAWLFLDRWGSKQRWR